MTNDAGERLLEAARARAADHPDARLQVMLDHAALFVFESGAGWESSHGAVRAVTVRLELDGHSLGVLAATPAVADALTEVLAAAAPDALSVSVSELTFAWGLTEAGGGYRDATTRPVAPHDPAAIQAAVAGYLRGLGDPDAADAIPAMRFAFRDGTVVVDKVTPGIEIAVRALLGREARVRS